MVDKRNRITKLIDYIESCGVTVNVGKNKALGNKGYFKVKSDKYRIDIAKGQTEDAILKILVHEYAHFVHYQYDKTLKKLDFIFNFNDELLEELISLTVYTIQKSSIEPLYKLKEQIQKEIKELVKKIKVFHPDFKENVINKSIEQKIKKTSLKYLLKYDRVKVFDLLSIKLYSVRDLNDDSDLELYIKIKSKKRELKRINSKITRINKYYNQPTELFARAFEIYVLEPDLMQKIAPNVYKNFQSIIEQVKIPQISTFLNIYNSFN